MDVINFLTTLDFSSPEGLMLACKFVSIPLIFVIIFFGYRYCKLTSLSTLRSFTIGFTFLIAADLFVLICILTHFEDKNSILWIQSILVAYGFSFIAVAYYYVSKSEKKLYSINKIFSFAVIPLIAYIGIMSILGLNEMSNFFSVEEYFIIYNLLILTYISKHTLQKGILTTQKEILYIPMAFVILWTSQFTLLLYSIDGNYEYLVSSIILKNAGLAVFVMMIFQVVQFKKKLHISK